MVTKYETTYENGSPKSVALEFCNYPTQVAWNFIEKNQTYWIDKVTDNNDEDAIVAALKAEFLTVKPIQCTDFEEFFMDSLLANVQWDDLCQALLETALDLLPVEEAAEPKMCGCDDHNLEEPHR